MATDKATVKKSLKTSLKPLTESLGESLNANMLEGLSADDPSLRITVVLKKEGVQTQTTLRFGRNKDGKCGYWPPEVFVGACLD